MRPFVYERPTSVSAAIAMASRPDTVHVPPTGADTQFIAGGTNLADYMKLGVARPEHCSTSTLLPSRPCGRSG